uniref:Uncharacterized protein n=1 Tax=Arundo donax TaxID=35708 RepID=A0A0A8YAF5_ARUDO
MISNPHSFKNKGCIFPYALSFFIETCRLHNILVSITSMVFSFAGRRVDISVLHHR